MAVALLAAAAAAVLVARPWQDVPPVMRPAEPPQEERSVSVDFGIVTDPETDWAAVDRHLDDAGANGVDLNAGRVEFTAFDWPAHPEVAAEPGTDHLARAARALHESADGTTRQVGLIVDAYVPAWITADPSVAGVSADGTRAKYQASASQLAHGPVGDRLVEYVAALGERYDPSQIAVTELFLNRYSFGDDDLDLYREMTGADDWPREADGAIDEDAPELGVWRSEVLAGLLGRMRSALDEVRGGDGAQIQLAMDVRVDWDDPAAGAASSGHDYAILLGAADRLVVWAYVGRRDRTPADVERVTAALEDGGFDMSRFTMSVGLWAGSADADPPRAISPELMAETVAAATTHGVEDVNVTPLSHLSDAHWAALDQVWGPADTP
ncbi:hypothetical protein [Krasilnikoviella flava]|uniref:Uncharacterized protein n=1 Tax=Krasilnikoviella flava TaxID=526729 RepID=A0A1T5M2N2_9MICO|nr:hypothetical protein [Krasilnikoviella flava]SKC82490.1 hypothetical protein SAMN04324258_4377 [Krasilnikoviella flava]